MLELFLDLVPERGSVRDVHELDGEVERGTPGNNSAHALLSIAQVGWDNQDSGLTFAHPRHALLVALDHLKPVNKFGEREKLN